MLFFVFLFTAGFALAFVTYPQAVSLISFSHVWAVAFFVMLFFLALGSEASKARTFSRAVNACFDLIYVRMNFTAV